MTQNFIMLLSWMCMLLVFGIFTSCEHRKLSDPYNGHYVRIYIDEQIKNVTYGFYDETRERPEYTRPRVLRVVLSDPVSNEIVSQRYLQTSGEDERGYYIDGYIAAEAGSYNLMAYNFGTERTKIRQEYSYNEMQAYTSPIPEAYYRYFPQIREEYAEDAIRYCPDHLHLALCQPVQIPRGVAIDTLRTADGKFFTAHSIVASYYLQIKIKGLNYISSAVSLLCGMAGSVSLCESSMNSDEPVNIFFDMNYTNVQCIAGDNKSSAILYATFNTFGKLPDEQNLYTLNFEFTRTDGSSQVESIDITSMFDEPIVKNERWILLETEIEITPPISSGGMTPGVDEWADVWTDIQL